MPNNRLVTCLLFKIRNYVQLRICILSFIPSFRRLLFRHFKWITCWEFCNFLMFYPLAFYITWNVMLVFSFLFSVLNCNMEGEIMLNFIPNQYFSIDLNETSNFEVFSIFLRFLYFGQNASTKTQNWNYLMTQSSKSYKIYMQNSQMKISSNTIF